MTISSAPMAGVPSAGTEPVLRVCAEARDEAMVDVLLAYSEQVGGE